MKITVFKDDTPEQVAERFCFVLAELGIRVREANSDRDSITFDLSHMTPLGGERNDRTGTDEEEEQD